MGNTLRQMQDHEPALVYCQRAHAIATALGDVETQVAVYEDMGQVYYDLGQYRQAMEHFQQILTAVPKIPSDQVRRGIFHPAIQAQVWRLECCRELGEFADGVAYGKEARQIAEAGGRPFDRLAVSVRLGRLQVHQGTLDQAIPLLEQAVALSQEADMTNFYRLAAAPLALAYARAGRATDALAMLGQRSGKTPYLNHSLTWGEVYIRTGHVEEGHRLTQEVLTDARRLKARGWEAWALWLLGEIAVRRDPSDVASAEVDYRQALALADELGMRPLVAHCHRGLGTLYATTGQREQARTALSTAIALYRAMEMTFWLPQTEAALAQVEGQ
jgi:tetratricopeptide (TPR) repeat protein